MLAVASASDIGLKRTRNEDRVAYWIPTEASDDRGTVLVIADGMGGSRGGEVASRLAVETVMRAYREAGGPDPLDDLHDAVVAANRVVHDHSVSDPNLRGMGTTCTAVVVIGRDILFAHVGDSRAYLLHQGKARQITRDHSLVAQLVESHQITPEEAREDPRRNVVTRSVGVADSIMVDADRVESALKDGVTLLVCTDGLHGLVEDKELADLGSAADLDQACADLVALARERGGHDNITLVLARWSDDGEIERRPGT